MSTSKTAATPQFVADFETVTSYYDLRTLGEYEDAKQAARRDMGNATTYYARMAAVIRAENRLAA